MICEYGCGNEATHLQTSGKWCCAPRYNGCPTIKAKNSQGLKTAYEDGRKDNTHWDGKRDWNKGLRALFDPRIRSKYRENGLFIYGGRGPHKEVLIEERGHRCEECGLEEWMGKPITLELEHTDGDTKNNVKANLKLLCCNCHSQTITWRRRKSAVPVNGCKHTEAAMIDAIVNSENGHQALKKLDLKWGSKRTLDNVCERNNINYGDGLR